MSQIEERLRAEGVTLPEVGHAPKAAGNYVPFVRTGNTIYVSGQISQTEDGLITGRLGEGLDVEAGARAARACAVALLTQLREACDGDLGRVTRVVKLVGFVNSAPAFTDQPKVINGASDLFVAIFGDAGRHARSAVGVAALPLGVAVEVEGIFEVR